MKMHQERLQQKQSGTPGKGTRSTKVQRALIEILANTPHPLSVPELLEALGKKRLTANKTTIYRQLESLREGHIVKEIPVADHALHYELAKESDHHHHLICMKCHAMQDVSFSEDLKRQERLIQKKYKFLLTHHSLEFYGYCERCQ